MTLRSTTDSTDLRVSATVDCHTGASVFAVPVAKGTVPLRAVCKHAVRTLESYADRLI